MKEMKNKIRTLFLLAVISLVSCQGLVDDINENPNDILIDDIEADLFLTGAMLSNTLIQSGHLNRISGLYTGQLIGYSSLYSNIYGYTLSTAESIATWSRIYVGGIPNLRHARNTAPDDRLLNGICKIVEAHSVGTGASLFGDIPYSEVSNPEIDNPKFDAQIDVFNACIALLQDGISDLNAASTRTLSADIYFGGDKAKWIEAANTIMARYHMQMGDYSSAYSAAQNGISSDAGSMQHIPRGDANIAEGDKNLFWEILEGSRAGDIGNAGSFMMNLIDPSMASSRNNSKTDETARFGYYTIDESGGSPNMGIIEQFEAQDLVSFAENHLILAEAGARTAGMSTGMTHLNEYRAWLNTGGMVNANFSGEVFLYEAYDSDDFANGGMENTDGIDPERALLREIIEERYVSGFGTYMPYNDARRLRKSDSDVAVDYILVDGPDAPYPERMPYSDDELNSNSSAPAEDPGIFVKTQVNQ